MLGMVAFMDWRGGVKTAQGIMWFAIAGIVGWPFALALAVPFLLEEAVLATVSRVSFEEAFWRVLDGVTRSLIVLVCALTTAEHIFPTLPDRASGNGGLRRHLLLPPRRGCAF